MLGIVNGMPEWAREDEISIMLSLSEPWSYGAEVHKAWMSNCNSDPEAWSMQHVRPLLGLH